MAKGHTGMIRPVLEEALKADIDNIVELLRRAGNSASALEDEATMVVGVGQLLKNLASEIGEQVEAATRVRDHVHEAIKSGGKPSMAEITQSVDTDLVDRLGSSENPLHSEGAVSA